MATVYGSLQGIRATYIKQVERLYETRFASDSFITKEFAEQLVSISHTIRQPICCYVNRRGQMIRVGIGTPMQTRLPEAELPRRSSDRLSGVRCIVSQFQPPDTTAFIAMLRQRLDGIVLLTLENSKTASIQHSYLLHLVPDVDQPWQVDAISLNQLIEQDADQLIDDWEKEIQDAGFDLSQTVEFDHDRALLIGLQTDGMSDQRFQDSINELMRLVESANGEVLGVMQQKRSHPHPQTAIGQGKVEELTLEAQRLGANLIVFNQDVSATQIRNLEAQIGVRVVDRTEVILDIFAQRARSQAGKLQVELAQLEYTLPRLRGRGQEMSRLGAGIGTRGPGETKLETERRTIQRRIGQLQQEVDQLQAHRARLRQHRDRQDAPTVALVGYTNAGKSTLLNVLTRAEVYVADQLFATLDPTTRRLTLTDSNTHDRRNLLLTDTVGFIHNLPPALMDAFRATLEEVTEADTLLHVLDLSHPAWEQHLQSVNTVLAELPATPPDAILVFNKIDRVDHETLSQVQQSYPEAVFISATKQINLEALAQRLLKLLDTLVPSAPTQ